MPGDLRTCIVMDYQNVHLTGHGLFASTRNLPRHETLIDPLMFAQRLLLIRNERQHPGMAHAALTRVLVYRGQPSPEHDSDGYARNQAQKSHWERDNRVQVTLRPLKYEYQRDASGRPSSDAKGHKVVLGKPREKGVDVLCALAAVREARNAMTDLVILASSDSDLAPALDEARQLGTAKIETFCWYDEPSRLGFQLHPIDRTRRLWNTRLNEAAFRACGDPSSY